MALERLYPRCTQILKRLILLRVFVDLKPEDLYPKELPQLTHVRLRFGPLV